MLSKKEKKIMQYILEESGNRDTCLLLPIDFVHALAPKYNINYIELQALLDGLVQENYITCAGNCNTLQLLHCSCFGG